jgi:hypothetical protein
LSDQVSHPYTTAGKTIVLCVLISTCKLFLKSNSSHKAQTTLTINSCKHNSNLLPDITLHY